MFLNWKFNHCTCSTWTLLQPLPWCPLTNVGFMSLASKLLDVYRPILAITFTFLLFSCIHIRWIDVHVVFLLAVSSCSATLTPHANTSFMILERLKQPKSKPNYHLPSLKFSHGRPASIYPWLCTVTVNHCTGLNTWTSWCVSTCTPKGPHTIYQEEQCHFHNSARSVLN